MTPDRVLAIVQAGGAGSRMDLLTRERAKPALPFGGIYQLVDFPMSNLRNSGIEDVWLSVQYQANSLDEQISNGRAWDLDRDEGGFRLLIPEQGGPPDADGFATGNADELFRVRDQIADHGAEVTLVLSSDHVYRFDFREAISSHRQRQAECTVVTSRVSRDEAGHHATITSNRQGRVTAFAYKPNRPRTGTQRITTSCSAGPGSSTIRGGRSWHACRSDRRRCCCGAVVWTTAWSARDVRCAARCAGAFSAQGWWWRRALA
jgi:glucose-1-phosphate adenylyltransferase